MALHFLLAIQSSPPCWPTSHTIIGMTETVDVLGSPEIGDAAYSIRRVLGREDGDVDDGGDEALLRARRVRDHVAGFAPERVPLGLGENAVLHHVRDLEERVELFHVVAAH